MSSSVSESSRAFQQDMFAFLGRRARMLLRTLLNQVMETEQMIFLGCMPHERTRCRRGWRNGYDDRRLATRWGNLELRMPKVRGTTEPFRTRVIERYQRYQRRIEEAVHLWAASGMSTRSIARALHSVFDCAVSAATVSRIIAQLDEELTAFHRRTFQRGYRYVFLDGTWGYVSQATGRRGRGRKRQAVLLLAWGIDHEGREELIDFRVASGEDMSSWMSLVTDLEARGVKGHNRWDERLELIVTDGAGGIEAACETVWPKVPRQWCAFHKVQTITEHLWDRRHRKAILHDAGRIYHRLQGRAQAWARLERWVTTWKTVEPEAVRIFCAGFERTLRYLEAPQHWRRRVKTNNPMERFIRELNRKFGPMGVFANAHSWERATYVTWKYLCSEGYPNSSSAAFTRNS
jgi:putative transposase